MKISAYIWMIVSLVMLNSFGLKSQVIAEAGKDTILCESGVVKLGGNPSATGGVGGYKYIWYCNEYKWIKKFASDFLNDTTLSNPDYTVRFSGIKFYLIVTDSLGNSDIDSIFIGLSIWTFLDDCPYIYPIKKGDKVQLCTDAFSHYTPYKFLWSPSNSLSDSTIWNPYASPESTTTYTVTITDSIGCKTTQNQYVQVLTSIAQDQKEELIKIFPNPFDKECIIKINTPEPSKVSLVILDISGKVVQTIKPETNSYELTKDNLPSGFYFILAKLNNEPISIKKLIVQ